MGTERVILIRGDNSKWYEQAIFIVRKNLPPGNNMPVDFVSEAERIINGYMTEPEIFLGAEGEPERKKAGRKNSGFDIALNIIMLVCIAILVGVLAWMVI